MSYNSSGGVESYKVAEHIYVSLLKSFGAEIYKCSQHQYSTNFSGSIEGCSFIFRVHHDKTGAFTTIDWQGPNVNDNKLQELKSFFNCMKTCISQISPAKNQIFLPHESELDTSISSLSIKDA